MPRYTLIYPSGFTTKISEADARRLLTQRSVRETFHRTLIVVA